MTRLEVPRPRRGPLHQKHDLPALPALTEAQGRAPAPADGDAGAEPPRGAALDPVVGLNMNMANVYCAH